MMNDELLRSMCIPRGASIRMALAAIDAGASLIALITDDDGYLAGIVTDGDIRRALLADNSLDSAVLPHANLAPRTVPVSSSRADALDLMRTIRINALPIVDEGSRVVGLQTLSEIIGKRRLTNHAVIMAGGRGTRLGELTKARPKPLMTVAGRAIIDWVVLGLVESGITDIHVSVAYLSDQIMDHLGDGDQLGCRIGYIHEDPDVPLNTAGALGHYFRQNATIDEPIIVTNADLMVRYNAADLLDFHASRGAAISVASRTYTHQVPFGVMEVDSESLVTGIAEKPQMEFEISAGIYAVSRAALELVPFDQPYSMPELMEACLQNGRRVASWPINSDWIDVGTPKDLATAKGH